MAVFPSRDELKIGLNVEIETKQDQGTGRLTAGILDKILTGGTNHPYGIKVRLKDGQVGRVKKVTGSAPNNGPQTSVDQVRKTTSSVPKEPTRSFVDLHTKPIPETEDVHNEFKEVYQYDDALEKFLGLKGDAENKAIDGIKRSVRQRFATAVCSFGNDYSRGFVYLGIRADGTVVGLERDMKLGNFENYNDEFANHITDTLKTFLQDIVFILSNIQIQFRDVNGKTICIVQVLPANRPQYLHDNNNQQFYVRGPAPRAEMLTGIEQIRYIMARFPNYG